MDVRVCSPVQCRVAGSLDPGTSLPRPVPDACSLGKAAPQDGHDLTRPRLGFKSFWSARCTIAGIEIMHAIRKGQLATTGNVSQTPAEQFYALAP